MKSGHFAKHAIDCPAPEGGACICTPTVFPGPETPSATAITPERLQELRTLVGLKGMVTGRKDIQDCLAEIDRLTRELAQACDEIVAIKHTIVHTVGGVDYEGFPTSEINYLQRLRILVEKEQRDLEPIFKASVRARRDLEADNARLREALVAARYVLMLITKDLGYIPSQQAYSTRMTEAQLQTVRAIESLDIILSESALQPAEEKP